MAHQPSATTGTVMRPDTLRDYAVRAGFAGIEVLDIADGRDCSTFRVRVDTAGLPERLVAAVTPAG